MSSSTMTKKVGSNSVSLIPPLSIRSLLKTKDQKYKSTCLSVIEHSRIFNFLGINDINEDTVNLVIDDILSIRDDQKILLTTLIINRWFYCKENDVYIKHIKSKTKNVLYQIILGNSLWDGVYELCLKGMEVNSKGYEENGCKLLEINSHGNYDAMLTIDKYGEEISVTRYEMSDEFNQFLLKNNFITEKELEVYTSKDVLTKQYLQKSLPIIKIT